MVVPIWKQAQIVDKARYPDENQNQAIQLTAAPDNHNVSDNQTKHEVHLLAWIQISFSS